MDLSPLDGRYSRQVEDFAHFFSEQALFRYRFMVEVEWFKTLAGSESVGELAPLDAGFVSELDKWVASFGEADVECIRGIEGRINHDVKAVEYYLKERLRAAGFGASVEFVHFAATSEDVNNLAYSLMLRDGLAEAWLPLARSLIDEVEQLALAAAAVAMPAHTHGQVATPTTLGKELAVFVRRWRRQLEAVAGTALTGKFNGAVGTFAAHMAAYPEVDWLDLSKRFVEGLGLEWNPLTTQIEPHDSLSEAFHAIVRFNSVLLDFCRDMWEYISRGYLRQQLVAGEVGSSTMPHKVNPIDFENSEANAGISSALLEHLATKLATSRMQRDLSDSSALRNVGVAVAHSGLAIRSARRGLRRVAPDEEVMVAELNCQWEVLAEAIQTVMRRYGLPEPYERLKTLTRGSVVNNRDVHDFILTLGLPAEAEKRLLALTPTTYLGLAPTLVRFAVPSPSAAPTPTPVEAPGDITR